MELAMGLMIGVGLSAACGFRVFVPLLGMSVASLAGHLSLASGFEWIGSWPALIAFGTATVLEIGAYCIPWLDNALDLAATPAAVAAATIITASQVGEASPLVRWSLAAVAGGGVCGVVQAGSVVLRTASTGTTGGTTNVLLSAIELFSSILFTLLALIVPIVCVLLVGWILYKMARVIAAFWQMRSKRMAEGPN